jgi:xanthine dehydrogenase accessory factor
MDSTQQVLSRIRDWQQAGRQVTVIRVVALRGISGQQGSPLAALTPGEPIAGTVLSGVADERLGAVERGTLLQLHVADDEAGRAGMSCGGSAQVLLQPLAEIPSLAFEALDRREPVCLVTELDGSGTAGPTEVYTAAAVAAAEQAHPGLARLFGRADSQGAVLDDGRTGVTVVWPVPALVVVGSGAIADALGAAAGLLGWTSTIVDTAADATSAIAGMAGCDGVVVLSHDRDVDGPALTAALASEVGYIGALGSRHTQEARTQWLGERGVTDLSRVHGPAGLDVDARTPAEIAVSVVAEMLAVRSGRPPVPLRDRLGPVHAG